MSQSGILDIEANNPQIPTSFVTNSGTAIPLVNVLRILGGTGITTSGSGNTVTINATTSGVESVTGTANQILASPTTGGVVLSLIGPYTPSTYTAHGVLIGEGTSSIAAVADTAASGIPLISQSAANPAFGIAVVAGGGTGDTSFTAYSVITGGTTSTAALQNVSGVGTSGQVLTSNGAAALPTWQNASAGGIVTIDGNTGSVTGSTVSIVTPPSTGTLNFSGSGITMTLNLIDGSNNIAIGAAPVVDPGASNCVILGTGAGSNGAGSVVIGNGASDNGNDTCVVIGNSIGLTNAKNVVAIGNGAMPNGSSSVSIGTTATTSGDYSIAIGITTTATGDSLAIGNSASATGSNSVCIGINATDNGGGSNVAIGQGANAPAATNGVAIGPGANCGAVSSVAIGQIAGVAGSGNSIAIGAAASVAGATSICVGGTSSDNGGSNNVILGIGSAAPSGGSSITIGNGAGISNTTGASNIAIGNAGVAAESNIIRIGTQGSGTGQQNACYVAGIFNTNSSGFTTPLPVFVDSSTGRLGYGSAAGPGITVAGDTGTASGTTITFNANTNSGSSIVFAASGAQVNLQVTDANSNTLLGTNAGNATLSGAGPGVGNSAFGPFALHATISGSANSVFGYEALILGTSANQNSVLGASALTGLLTGNSNTVIGYTAGSAYTSSETSNILISNAGVVGESNVIHIGTQGTGDLQQNKCFIAGIAGVTVSSSAAVLINTSTGQLGTVISSLRYKENIKPLHNTSSIYDLNVCSFNYKSDPNKTIQFGLIAEQVHDVMPNLVTYDMEGRPDSVKYHELPILLLAEIQKIKAEIGILKRI